MSRSKGIPKQQTQAEAKLAPGAGGDAAYPDLRHDAIAEAAYYKADRRGFAPGSDMQDWLDAERGLDGDEQRA